MEGGEKKFSQIPAYSGLRGVVRNASHVQERRTLIKQNKSQEAEQLPVHYICGYHDIPDKNLVNYPLYSTEIKAQDVDYDLIVYDTYDYLDKLIGFKLSDIFYAIFDQYYILMLMSVHENLPYISNMEQTKIMKYGCSVMV